LTYTLFDEFSGAADPARVPPPSPGVELVIAANHKPIAIESHAVNFPAAAEHYLGDVRSIDMRKFGRTDIFWSSPSCFPAGTLILTKRGLVPIDEVVVGDEAFTHERRWKPVTATMIRIADTVTVKANGLATEIETTREHPFYTRRRIVQYRNRRRRWRYEDPAWTETARLERLQHLIATPADFGQTLPGPDWTMLEAA
jgi:hypothetical protein